MLLFSLAFTQAKLKGLNSIAFEIEAEIIVLALKESNFNRDKAAKLLKIKPSTMRQKVRNLILAGYDIPTGVSHRPLSAFFNKTEEIK